MPARRPADAAEIGRDTIASGHFLALRRIRWRDPDGRGRQWESAERVSWNGAVVVIPRLEPTGEYLLVRQYRPPARTTVLEFPAGLLEPGEDPAAGALRELREETGYTARVERLTPAVFTSPGLTNESVHTVLVSVDLAAPENRDARPAPDDGEFIERVRVHPAAWPALLAAEIAHGGACDSKPALFFSGFAAGNPT